MKCKVCGYVPDSRVRFCPNCQSYFVDSDDTGPSGMWKGINDAEGNTALKLPKEKYAIKQALPGRILSIACFAVSSVNLILTLVAVLAIENLMLAAMPLFVVGIIIFFLTKRHRLSWFALLELIFSFTLFLWRFGS